MTNPNEHTQADFDSMYAAWREAFGKLDAKSLARLDQAAAHYRQDMATWGIDTETEPVSKTLGYFTALMATVIGHNVDACAAGDSDTICPGCAMIALDDILLLLRVIGQLAMTQADPNHVSLSDLPSLDFGIDPEVEAQRDQDEWGQPWGERNDEDS